MRKYLTIILLTCLLPATCIADDDDYAEDPITQWINAARFGNIESIKKMFQQGFNIETQTKGGNSALKIASKKNHVQLAKFLISKGAEIDSRSRKKGSTPLHASAKRGHLEIVKLLLQHKANFNIKTHKGNTPLNLAAFKNHPDVVKELLKVGANLESQNNKGQTPLCQAAIKNSLEVTQILLAHGADPLMVDNNGNTVIHLAKGNSSDIVLGTVNATSIVIDLSKETIDDDTFTSSIKSVLPNRVCKPEQKSPQQLFAHLKKNARLFRIHLERIGSNLLLEYRPGYGSNKRHYLENIKHDLLLTLAQGNNTELKGSQ